LIEGIFGSCLFDGCIQCSIIQILLPILWSGPITSLSQASFQPVPDWVLLEASRS
jgi:hypothetical protein